MQGSARVLPTAADGYGVLREKRRTNGDMLDLYVYTCGELRRDADRHHERVVTGVNGP